MFHSLRNNEALLRKQLDGPILELDHEAAGHDVEELVQVVMFVPVILALDDAEPHHRLVDLAESLVVPRHIASIDEHRYIDDLERAESNVEMRLVRKI